MDGVQRRHTAPLLCTLAAAALAGLTPRPTFAGEPAHDVNRSDLSATELRAADPRLAARAAIAHDYSDDSSAACPDSLGRRLLQELIEQIGTAAVILFLPPTFPQAPSPAPPPAPPPPPPPPPPPDNPPPTVTTPPPVELPPGNSTPEPATLLTGLIGCGMAGLYAAYRRRRGQ